ncbi:MAG TPA: hypothetical protein VGL03_15160 [Thermoanaerobaculia bacterium]
MAAGAIAMAIGTGVPGAAVGDGGRAAHRVLRVAHSETLVPYVP